MKTLLISLPIVLVLNACGKSDDDTSAAEEVTEDESFSSNNGMSGGGDGGGVDGGSTDGADVGSSTGGSGDSGGTDGGASNADDGGSDDGGESEPEGPCTSCWRSIAGQVCVEPNEPDNNAWCIAEGGLPSDKPCLVDGIGTQGAGEPTGMCTYTDVGGPGSNLTAPAQTFYFRGYDGEAECNDSRGSFGFVDQFCGS